MRRKLQRWQQQSAGLLDEFHYLGASKPVGERIWYAALAPDGGWLGVLLFTAAARRLRHRDEWIGWSDEQRRRRLPLVANDRPLFSCRCLPCTSERVGVG